MMHLFLSPHFDDAVLSCGGTIHNLVRSGSEVAVLTVMGGNPFPDRIPDTPHVRHLHSRWGAGADPVAVRIREDQAALNTLGAKALLADYLDAVYRVSAAGEPLYPFRDSIFGEVHPDDPARQLSLPPSLDFQRVHTLYAPLGAGHHVDHQLVRDWALVLPRPLALKFYAEYPYTEAGHAIEQALAYFPADSLTPEVQPLLEDDVKARIRAITCYESQISTFWESVAAMEQATRRSLHQAGNGVPVEPFWRYNL